MLDMSFQLLSFFILTFHPMPTEGQLSINLPKLDATEKPPAGRAVAARRQEGRIHDSVNASADGGVSNISLKGPTGGSEDIKGLADLLVQLKAITPPAGKKRRRGGIDYHRVSRRPQVRPADRRDGPVQACGLRHGQLDAAAERTAIGSAMPSGDDPTCRNVIGHLRH